MLLLGAAFSPGIPMDQYEMAIAAEADLPNDGSYFPLLARAISQRHRGFANSYKYYNRLEDNDPQYIASQVFGRGRSGGRLSLVRVRVGGGRGFLSRVRRATRRLTLG